MNIAFIGMAAALGLSAAGSAFGAGFALSLIHICFILLSDIQPAGPENGRRHAFFL